MVSVVRTLYSVALPYSTRALGSPLWSIYLLKAYKKEGSFRSQMWLIRLCSNYNFIGWLYRTMFLISVLLFSRLFLSDFFLKGHLKGIKIFKSFEDQGVM